MLEYIYLPSGRPGFGLFPAKLPELSSRHRTIDVARFSRQKKWNSALLQYLNNQPKSFDIVDDDDVNAKISISPFTLSFNLAYRRRVTDFLMLLQANCTVTNRTFYRITIISITIVQLCNPDRASSQVSRAIRSNSAGTKTKLYNRCTVH